jgi:hypothetical protein
MFRFKGIFGSRFRARRLDYQRVDGWITCMVLNRMVSLGMPISERMYSSNTHQRKTGCLFEFCNNAEYSSDLCF